MQPQNQTQEDVRNTNEQIILAKLKKFLHLDSFKPPILKEFIRAVVLQGSDILLVDLQDEDKNRLKRKIFEDTVDAAYDAMLFNPDLTGGKYYAILHTYISAMEEQICTLLEN